MTLQSCKTKSKTKKAQKINERLQSVAMIAMIIMYIHSGNQVFSLSNISMQQYQENGSSKVRMCGQMGDKIEEVL